MSKVTSKYKVRVQLIEEPTRQDRKYWKGGSYAKMKMDSKKPYLSRSYFVNYYEINSISKLSRFVHNMWGDGTFNVVFFGFAKNKSVRHKFRCILLKGQRCIHKETHKCRLWKKALRGAEIHNCRKNPLMTNNWYPRARITITEKYQPLSEPLILFKWHTDKDKMHKMNFYFKRDRLSGYC